MLIFGKLHVVLKIASKYTSQIPVTDFLSASNEARDSENSTTMSRGEILITWKEDARCIFLWLDITKIFIDYL